MSKRLRRIAGWLLLVPGVAGTCTGISRLDESGGIAPLIVTLGLLVAGAYLLIQDIAGPDNS